MNYEFVVRPSEHATTFVFSMMFYLLIALLVANAAVPGLDWNKVLVGVARLAVNPSASHSGLCVGQQQNESVQM